MNDSLTRIDPEETAIDRPTPTARRLVEASVSPNTRRAYAGALRRLDAWLDGRELHDVTLAAYLAELHDAGRASSSIADGVDNDHGLVARNTTGGELLRDGERVEHAGSLTTRPARAKLIPPQTGRSRERSRQNPGGRRLGASMS